MNRLLLNIDVPDLASGERFYVDALGLRAGRRFSAVVELLGLEAPLYLLEKAAGTPVAAGRSELRDYARHWCPWHPDIAVPDLPQALARAIGAGATVEGEIRHLAFGQIATLADPFGNGFCLIEFTERGYDAILD